MSEANAFPGNITIFIALLKYLGVILSEAKELGIARDFPFVSQILHFATLRSE
jgi:hypothetical protein